MVEILGCMLRSIMKERFVPRQLKRSNIVLIHKGGTWRDPLNYRPISLLQTAFKLLDSWLMLIIRGYIIQAGDHASTQYGFRKGKSCAQ